MWMQEVVVVAVHVLVRFDLFRGIVRKVLIFILSRRNTLGMCRSVEDGGDFGEEVEVFSSVGEVSRELTR